MDTLEGAGDSKKASVSYAAEVSQQRELAKSGQLDGAIQNLLALEKTARLAADVGGTTELVVAMVEFCYEAKDWPRLNETITMLAKRRAQLKQAITQMIQLASKYVDELTDPAIKLPLIETLRAVSEGKMFVEVERARLTKTLAGMHEAKGEVEEARKIMQDTQVETLGGMDKREKTFFILEQVRLCLETKEYIRAQIMARKINVKVFRDTELDDLKMSYYSMIVAYHQQAHNWMEIFRAYQATWDTKLLQDDKPKAERFLKLQVLYLVLSPYDNEQSEMLHALQKEKQLEAPPLALYKELIKHFVTKEVFHFASLEAPIAAELDAFGSFDAEERKLMLETLHSRVTQHNIAVVAGYYTRITMERFASLLMLPMSKMEEELCALVSKKTVYARIDRPAGVISFAPPKTPNELLNDWSSDISEMLNLLESTCHLIHKDNMIHKIV